MTSLFFRLSYFETNGSVNTVIIGSPRILLVDQDIWNIEDDFIPSPAGDGMKIGFSRPPDGVPA
jgi:hypothetical protein